MWRYGIYWAIVLSSIGLGWLVQASTAEPRHWAARSGAETNTLVELYTSEG